MKYIYWFWDSLIPKKKIKLINSKILKLNLVEESKERTATDLNNKSKKNNKCYILKFGEIKHLIQDYLDLAKNANNVNFGFDIFDVTNLTFINYNIYDSENKSNYDWHMDCSRDDKIDTKLTFLINLSEENFEGGDFLLRETDDIIVEQFKKPGSMLIFKSSVLHAVTPVTKGTRRTLTIFLDGPCWK